VGLERGDEKRIKNQLKFLAAQKGNNMSDEKKPKEQNIFAHLGGKLILDADPHGEPVDLSPAYGATGRLVYAPPESDAFEELK
jgi:hypothetical protein